MQKKIHLLLGLFIFFCSCFEILNAKAMFGDNVREVLTDDEYPFVVSIGLKVSSTPLDNRTYKHFCTGSLVSNRDVLTSEHCMDKQNFQRIRIHVGSRSLKKGVKFIPLWWVTYDQWAESQDMQKQYIINDITILRLKGNVRNIQPAVISNNRIQTLHSLEVLLAGWGKKQDGTRPTILQTGIVKVLDLIECANRIHQVQGKPIVFESNIMCTVARPQLLVHQGDSGGPVLYMNEIVGITKGACPYPDNFVHPGKLNIHFGIHYYRNFIYNIIAYP